MQEVRPHGLLERIMVAIRVVKAPVLLPARRNVPFAAEVVPIMQVQVNAHWHHSLSASYKKNTPLSDDGGVL